MSRKKRFYEILKLSTRRRDQLEERGVSYKMRQSIINPSEEIRRSLVEGLINENEGVVSNKEVVKELEDMVASELPIEEGIVKKDADRVFNY